MVTFHGISAAGNISPLEAKMSSSWPSYPASNCIDGNPYTMCHTRGSESYPWVTVVIPRSIVRGIRITNRANCCGDRMKNVKIWVGNGLPSTTDVEYTGGTLLGTFPGPGIKDQVLPINTNTEMVGTHVVVQMRTNYISLMKIEVLGEPVPDADADKVPVGAIIPWVDRVEKDGPTVDLPSGFQRCDGSTILIPSIWAGQATPNLNLDKRFLRGGSDSDVLTMEDDQIQDHEHIDNGHEHSASSSSPPHDHGFSYIQTNWRDHSCDMADGTYWCFSQNNIEKRTDKTTISIETTVSKAQSNIGGVKSNYRTGSETRPRNMNIIYIMRVF